MRSSSLEGDFAGCEFEEIENRSRDQSDLNVEENEGYKKGNEKVALLGERSIYDRNEEERFKRGSRVLKY